MKIISLFLACIILTACTTTYQPSDVSSSRNLDQVIPGLTLGITPDFPECTDEEIQRQISHRICVYKSSPESHILEFIIPDEASPLSFFVSKATYTDTPELKLYISDESEYNLIYGHLFSLYGKPYYSHGKIDGNTFRYTSYFRSQDIGIILDHCNPPEMTGSPISITFILEKDHKNSPCKSNCIFQWVE